MNRSVVRAIHNALTSEVGEVRSEYMELRKTLRDNFSSETKKSTRKVYCGCKPALMNAEN